MTFDPYKNVTVYYNHLNLPKHFEWLVDPLADTYQHIYITYDHSGKKLQKQVKNTSGATVYTQDYVDGLEYRTNGGGALTLEAIYHAEGRITPNGANYQYEYTIKDHLGNARISFADLNANSLVDVPGDILQENHYYPFGMNMSYGWMNNVGLVDDRHQYNGKELNDDFGLNWNDYRVRWYDAAVGRFPNVDPLIEKFPYLTPFNYASNEPIAKIDLYGLQGIKSSDLGNWLIENDQTGLITTATPEMGDKQPFLAGLIDGSYIILSSFGLNVVDNSIAHAIDPDKSPKQKESAIFGELYNGFTPIKNESPFKNEMSAEHSLQNSAETTITPSEPYNRSTHYGNTPKASDRKALGAEKGDVVDHNPPLVQRYYEGDPLTGEKPGYQMTQDERLKSANDRSRMQLQPNSESNKQGAEMAKYSKEQKQKHFGQ